MRSGIFSSVSLLVFLSLVPGVAFAGFEFVAPQAAAPAPAPVADAPDAVPPLVAGDSAPVDMGGEFAETPVAKIVKQDNARAAIPLEPIEVPLTPVVANSDALLIETRPLEQAAAFPPAAAALPSQLPTHFRDAGKMNEGGNVQGFGRGVPLAIALQQIVPPSYRYAFEAPINPSMRISWSGDKPWKAVIADIARSNDMNVDIASNVVSFSRHKPMEMIDAGTRTDSAADMVQGIPLRPVAGQPAMVANAALPDPVMPAPVAMAPAPTPAPAPAPVAAPLAPVAKTSDPDLMRPPVVADAAPSAPIPAPRDDIADLVYDAPATRQAYGAQPAPLAKPAMKAAPAPRPAPGERQALASISEAPLDAPVAPPAAQPAEQKSAFFDGLMDQPGNKAPPAKAPVKEKQILTADRSMDQEMGTSMPLATPSAKKAPVKTAAPASGPMDILDPAPAMPLPLAGASNDGQKIDNAPVASNDLPAPVSGGIVAAAPVSAELSDGHPDLTTSREWKAIKGQTLRQTLTAWAQEAGASLVWSSEYDYPLRTDVRIQSSYADAVRTLLDGFSKAEPRPIGRLFKNDKVGAQPVLIIETQRLTD